MANNAALVAIAANDRSNGMLVVQIDNQYVWQYASASAAAASDWCVVPTDGAGRWLRCDQTVGAIISAVANNAALVALTAVNRKDGTEVVKLDDYTIWIYAIGAADAASDWCQVPTDTVGRWYLKSALKGTIHLYVADSAALQAVAATGRTAGMLALKYDDGTLWAFNAASTEAASSTCIVPSAGTGTWLFVGARWGTPMSNRVRMLGAPGKIVQGDTVTIGAIVFEFRDSTPPAGGTAGRIWVYNGASSADSRTNFIDAVNGVVDAARITYNAVTPPNFFAAAGVTLGDVKIQSATAPGGTPCGSATATACSETLTTVADIWDAAACYGGTLAVKPQSEAVSITLAAPHIAKGNVQFNFTFAPRVTFLWNRSRAQNEAYTVIGNTVSLTLAGGVSPNNQATDIVDCVAFS